MIREQHELMDALQTTSGADLLSALPLIAAHIQSAPIVIALRGLCDELVPRVQHDLDRNIAIVAFGSVGRLEYVPGYSDLDSMVIVDGGPLSNEQTLLARTGIFTELARLAPWMAFDHRAALLAGDWHAIPTADIAFPILSTSELLADNPLASQRRWQLLLEGRCLFNDPLFHAVYRQITPTIRPSMNLMGEEHPAGSEPDFRALTGSVGELFGSFHNPMYLYKSTFKYFKTRFLRDFFMFGVQLDLLLGWYRQRHHEELGSRYIRAATVARLIRSLRFSEELDNAVSKSAYLDHHYTSELKGTLTRIGIGEAPLLSFGTSRRHRSAQLLQGLLISVLSRFADCWKMLYDINTRAVLHDIPPSVNPESPFPQSGLTSEQRHLLRELKQKRDSYRRYMKASAIALQTVFPKGHVWTNATVPSWVAEALDPFIQEISPAP